MNLFGSLVLKMSEATFRPAFLKVGRHRGVSRGPDTPTDKLLYEPFVSCACSYLTGPHRRVGVAVGVVRGL